MNLTEILKISFVNNIAIRGRFNNDRRGDESLSVEVNSIGSSIQKNIMVKQKYYIATGTRVPSKVNLLIAIALLLVPIFDLINHTVRIIDPFLFILSILLGSIAFGKIRLTGIELSDHGLKVNFFIFLRNNLVFSRYVPKILKWNELHGMLTYPAHVYSFDHKEVAKIFIKDSGKKLKYLLLESTSFEKASELFDTLKNRIPEMLNNNEIFKGVLRHPLNEEINYKNLTLTRNGITDPNETIPWDSLKIITYDDFNTKIDGYGTIIIGYQNSRNQAQSIKIEPEMTDQFRDFLRFCIKNAGKASIDPSLLKFFDKAYERERRFIEIFVIAVIIVLICFFGYFIYYVFL